MNEPFDVLKKYVPLHLKGNRKVNVEVFDEKEEFVKFVVGEAGELKQANMILNNNLDFTELVFYKENFTYTTNKNLKEYTIDGEKIIKNGRKFIEEDGILKPKENIVLNDLARSINNSTKRSKASFYSYGLNNDFQYFLTLTFDGSKVDRNDDEAVKNLYKKFRQKLQYINKDVKILAVPERHKPTKEFPKGALHLHCLVGNIDLSKYMSIAISPHSLNNVKCKVGIDMYNLINWNFGYSTIVEFPKNFDRLRVINYCIAYTTKADNIGYNKKRFFKTGNLNAGVKHIGNMNKKELEEIMKLYNFQVYKDNEKILVLRYIKKQPGQLSFLKVDKSVRLIPIKNLGKQNPFRIKRKGKYEKS